MKKIMPVLCFLSFGVIQTATAQTKHTQTASQVWTGYFNQTRFSNKWGIWADGHLRTKNDLLQGLSQGILRFGLTYYVADATKLTAGFAYVNHFPADNHKNISQPEYRPWQQIQWHTKYPKTRTMQWLRLEERYRRKIENESRLSDDYAFNFRLRYNFLLLYPIGKKGTEPHTFSLALNDEVHINFGKEILNNYFDQNRFFVGLNYHINRHDNFQFGYMNLFQQLAPAGQYRLLHTARLFYFHNIDLRKSKS